MPRHSSSLSAHDAVQSGSRNGLLGQGVATEAATPRASAGATRGVRTPKRAAAATQSHLPSVSLPKGGGAIRGMGEKFSNNPVNGSAIMTVPIPVSPGRSGFTPELQLSYDSGAGNGPFGFGWDLSLPRISRKTDKGLPRYQDADESDVFILSGAEDLVPKLREDGSRFCDTETALGFVICRYVPRVEGLFARIEKWTETATGDVHWRSISRDNVTALYGRDNRSRIFDPAERNSAHPRRVFEWLICERYDDRGNAMVYEYEAENEIGVDRSQINERNRLRTANRYLKRVKYGNKVSRLINPNLNAAEWLFELVLDYGEAHYVELPLDSEVAEDEQHRFVLASADSDGLWKVRPDPFSRYRCGFEVRTYRRCHRILMFHRFEEELGPEAYLVRAVAFDYKDLTFEELNNVSVKKELERQGSTRYASFICRVIQSGFVRQVQPIPDVPQHSKYLRKSLPPLDFEYSKAVIQEKVETLDDQSCENLPIGVDGIQYQWTDLDGEGLPGILNKEGDAWRYKPNLGSGTFGSMQLLKSQPSLFTDERTGGQLIDLSGDGQLDLVTFAGRTPGFYKRTVDYSWDSFRSFRRLPNIRWGDANLRFVDLNGDGHADILITEHEIFTWHPSLAEDGFGPARQTPQFRDEEAGPRLVFADGVQSVLLADMSGDGLADLVRVRNGETCYWPNVGYGRFGAKVTMDNAPSFDHPDQFDQTRIRLVDVDGSGTADIMYIGRKNISLYFNQSGNAWSRPRRLNTFPETNNFTSVTTIDLRGNGTACLVWSSGLPGSAHNPLQYIDLMGNHKPHLLVRAVNNLGAETHVKYVASTKFYLQDKLDGKPWITRIPFPVQVVERVDTYDHISRNRFVSLYVYHHGFFDGHEREFRGFGLVEQFDTEELAALSTGGVLPAGVNFEASSHVPPVLTKTWFHTGVHLGRDHVSNYFAGLPGGSETVEYFREPGFNDAQARELLLEDTILPTGLTAEEEREACRALRGSLLRQEVYALDGSDTASFPYAVTERNYGVKRLQGRGNINPHAVFLTHNREEIVYNYERTLFPILEGQLVDLTTAAVSSGVEWRLDPRIAHSQTLEVDDFGNVLKAASIGYGRHFADPSLPQSVREEQAKTHMTYTESRVTNYVDSANSHRVPFLCEARTYELTGYTPSGPAGRVQPNDLLAPTPAAPNALIPIFDEELEFEEQPTGGRQRRLIEHVRNVFRRDDLEGPLPLGQLESKALPFETYKLALTPGLVRAVFNEGGTVSRVADAMLDGRGATPGGRYVHTRDETGALDSNWWVPSGRVFFSPGSWDSAAQELLYARTHFYLPHRVRDPFHMADAVSDSFVMYDRYDLMVQETRDALANGASATAEHSSNRVTVGERNIDPTKPLIGDGHNYRVLQPALVMDPNRNRTAIAYDALGMVVGTAVMGKPEDNPAHGDRLTEAFRSDLTQAELDAFLTAPKGPVVAQLLADSTTRIVTDITAYFREPDVMKKTPVFSATLARETHVSEPRAPGGLRIQTSFLYSDGFGREVQRKMQAEPGPVPARDATGVIVVDANNQPQMTSDSLSPRWVGSGWVVYNNKGKPVRQYEPYFTDKHSFEFDVRIGKSAVLFYDPVTRMVAMLHPNHTWEKTVFGPWRQASWDVGDTVGFVAPENDPDVGDFFRRLPHSDYKPTWHALRTDAAHNAAFLVRYPDATQRNREESAARKSEVYAETPVVGHADSLGRTIVTVAHNRFKFSDTAVPMEEFYSTHAVFDIEGNQREIFDAKDRLVARYDYDMVGNQILQSSMEAGCRLTLNDVAGKPLYGWDSRGHRFRSSYDVLQRPVDSLLLQESGPEVLLARTVYGESHPDPEMHNLRLEVVELFDQVGVVYSSEYDFKGNLLRSARQLADTVQIQGQSEPSHRNRLDWHGDITLAVEKYISETRFDALNRPIQIVAPHRDQPQSNINIIQPAYNDANLLERMDVWLAHGSVPAACIDPTIIAPASVGVANIDYDAKAQRLRVDYKTSDPDRRFSTHYRYDPETFLLSHMYTHRGPAFATDCQNPNPPPGAIAAPDGPKKISLGMRCGLQNLRYTYDVAGNVAHIHDSAQQTIFFANTRVEPSAEYTYDATFRLIEATGREHLGQSGGSPIPHTYNDWSRLGRSGIPHPNDGKALGTYLERFLYDEVGNIKRVRHASTDPRKPGWTCKYTCSEPSQLEPDKVSNRLTSTTIGNNMPVPYSDAGDGYDAHGNMLRMPQLRNMRWNEHDQLQMTQRQAVNKTDADGEQRHGERTWYVYDACGQRARKVTELENGQIKEARVYLGGFEIYDRPGTNGLVRETLHIMDDKRRIAMVETRVDGTERGIPKQLVRYQLGNHLGSACVELDDQARVLSYEEYTPYGSTAYQAVRNQIQAPKRYRFTRKERDEESGLYYNGARYYAPWLGRWSSTDPAGLVDGVNIYAYVKNSPVSLSDPTGLWSWKEIAVAAAVVVVGTVVTVATAGAAAPVAAAAVASLGLTGTAATVGTGIAVGAVAGAVGGAAAGAAGEGTRQAVHGEKLNVGSIASAAGEGAVIGGALGAAIPLATAAAAGAAGTTAGAAVVGGVSRAGQAIARSGAGRAVASGARAAARAPGIRQGIQGAKSVARATSRGLQAVERTGRAAGERVVRGGGGRAVQSGFRGVSTGGKRGEVPLTKAQREEVLDYARRLGIPEEVIQFSNDSSTGYLNMLGSDMLVVGTDVMPAASASVRAGSANARVSMRGAIAHEWVGHRAAAVAGKTQASHLLEEVQASVRAARFAPDLSSTERLTLVRDAVERLRNAGMSVSEVKGQLWISQP